MDDVINVITEKLGGFTAEQDVTRIYEVLDALEAAERDLPPSDATRRLAIERRLYFLAALDDHIDPRWDEARRPVVGAPPPPSHHGPVYPTGQVDPSDIACLLYTSFGGLPTSTIWRGSARSQWIDGLLAQFEGSGKWGRRGINRQLRYR